jgi:hypothetical protein
MFSSMILNDAFASKFWRKKVYYHANALSASLIEAFDIAFLEKRLSNKQYLKRNDAMLRSSELDKPIYVSTFEQIKKGWHDGKTFQIYCFDKELPYENEIYKFAGQLERYLLHPLEAISLFISPPNSKAIKLHCDTREIFTLQIAGSKIWNFPDYKIHNKKAERVVTLSKGDLLYIPAKLNHEVHAHDSFSISLALVFRPLRFDKLIQFVTTKQLHEKLSALTLPILDQEDDTKILENEIDNFLNEIKTHVNNLTLDTIVKKLSINALSCVSAEPVHFYEDFTVSANFKVNNAIKYEIVREDNTATLYLYGGKRISFHANYSDILSSILCGKTTISLTKILQTRNLSSCQAKEIELLLHKLWASNVLIQESSCIQAEV